MKKYIITACTFACILAGGVATTSCSDPDPVQDLVLSRVLSPSGARAVAEVTEPTINVTWNEMSNAESYIIEAFALLDDEDAALEDATFEGVTPDVHQEVSDTKYTLTGLSGETMYAIRIKGIAEGIDDSRWTYVSRKTAAEQIVKAVRPADITTTTVTIRWTAGEGAATINVVPVDASSNANSVTYTVTAADIAAGEATVSGLSGDTNYKATLVGTNGKTRGTATFTTNIDLSDAILVSTDEELKNALTGVTTGSKFKLAPGTYTIGTVEVNQSVTIGAADSGNQPIINGDFKLMNGVSFYAFQIIFDGDGRTTGQAFAFGTATTYGSIVFDGCEIKNYSNRLMYIGDSDPHAILSSIIIKNCIIHDVNSSTGEMFDFRKGGGYNNIELLNSTIYNSSSAHEIFRQDDASANVTLKPSIRVDHCTFYKVGNGNTTKQFFYIRYPGNSNMFQNNLVAEFNNTRGFAQQAATGEPTFGNNYYYGTENLLKLADGNTQAVKFFDTSGTELTENPFTDADNANFIIKTTFPELYLDMPGDPRWYQF